MDVAGESVEVRLDGINAPESDECLGDAARALLDELAAGEVEIEVTGTDQFGRTLALVTTAAGSLSLNEVMVREGFALATTGGLWSDRLVDAEEDARTSGRGIWGSTACGEPVRASLRIEFTRPDPPGPDRPDDELISIFNHGSEAIDLASFVVRDESSANRLVLPAESVVPPGSSIEVWSGCEPPTGVGWCSDNPIWNNDGDSALLLSPTGNVVAHARHDPGR